MSDAFTPGPWSWEEAPTHDTYEGPMDRLLGPGGAEVCNFGDCTHYYPVEGIPPNAADKRLMSAAPDLLAAIEALVAYQESTDLDDEPEDGEYGDGKRALVAARAAIAKAKGESP